MDAFNSLTVGANFDNKRHRDEMKLFHTKANHVSGDGGVVDAVKETHSSLHVPPIPKSLMIFGEGDDERREGNEVGEATAPDRPAQSVHAPLKEMSRKRMTHLWKKHSLLVTGADIPSPIEHYSSLVRPPLNVPEHVVSNLFSRNHKIPTPIQMQAIPALIHKKDLLACAPTGSGKTLAFLIPMFALLKAPNPERGVRALIISPTMELAVQIEREAFFLIKGNRWKFVQHGQTTSNKDIFITTPGRVASMIDNKLIDLKNVEFLVFDEGDKLWDEGTDFLQVIDKIIHACSNPNKVVALFSATLSQKVESNAKSVMSPDAVRIIVKGRTSANNDVEQRLLFCTNELGKVIAIRNFIREGIKPPVLIFVQSIERTKELFDEIRCQGLHVGLINSKMTSDERDEVVLNFRLGKTWVLITTELLARGIDFKNIGTVINFDLPLTPESYVHRVGRTGRAGKKGLAVTFFTTDDVERLPPIAKIVKESGSPVEDWMLTLKVTKRREKQLANSTPHRMIVSTDKRILVGQQRMERQRRAAERDEEGKAKKKPRLEDSDLDGDE